ncbi:MAG: polyprenyl synthetase family protein [Candidatus Thorarchaeota archaeon]|nr:MAG: polyprenyl synthetase family protein [Candidatus Thorarchaeota archaeon]
MTGRDSATQGSRPQTDESPIEEKNDSSKVESDTPEIQIRSSLIELLDNDELKTRMKSIDNAIMSCLMEEEGKPAQLYETAAYLIRAGGKRLRSLLVVLSCEAVEGKIEDALPFAIATEFVQTASLIHDDIIDDDAVRRGVESVHRRFGLRFAILAGDLLVAQALKLVGGNATPDLMVHIANGGIRMCEGQAADILMTVDDGDTLSEEDYLHMIERKTVSFMREAARMGAAVGEASDEKRDALIRYAENLGYGFQIRDDILDILGTQRTTGKSVQTDIKLKRYNFPLVHALKTCSNLERELCLRGIADGDFDRTLKMIEDTGAVGYAIDIAQHYIEKAKAALIGHDFKNQNLLQALADFVLSRIH